MDIHVLYTACGYKADSTFPTGRVEERLVPSCILVKSDFSGSLIAAGPL